MDIDALVAKQVDAGMPMLPPAPILPEERMRADGVGMQQDTHSARVSGVMAVPLTLLTERTGTTVSNPGLIDHA